MKPAGSKQTDTPSPETKLNSGTPCQRWLWMLKYLQFTKWPDKVMGQNSAVLHNRVQREGCRPSGRAVQAHCPRRGDFPWHGEAALGPIVPSSGGCFCAHVHPSAPVPAPAALILQRLRGHTAHLNTQGTTWPTVCSRFSALTCGFSDVLLPWLLQTTRRNHSLRPPLCRFYLVWSCNKKQSLMLQKQDPQLPCFYLELSLPPLNVSPQKPGFFSLFLENVISYLIS